VPDQVFPEFTSFIILMLGLVYYEKNI